MSQDIMTLSLVRDLSDTQCSHRETSVVMFNHLWMAIWANPLSILKNSQTSLVLPTKHSFRGEPISETYRMRLVFL